MNPEKIKVRITESGQTIDVVVLSKRASHIEVVIGAPGAPHFEIVAEYQPVETHSTAQYIAQPPGGEAGRLRIDVRIQHVRRHDRFEQALVDQRRERHEIVGGNLGVTAWIDRQVGVRIDRDIAVTGKMLADRRHAASMQAATERRSEHRYRVRLTMECAIADDGAHAKIEIEHRSEAEIDAACGELIC